MWLPGSPAGERVSRDGPGWGAGWAGQMPGPADTCANPVASPGRGRMRGACERVEAGDARNTWRGGQDTPEVTLGYEEPLTRQLSLKGGGGQAGSRKLSGK